MADSEELQPLSDIEETYCQEYLIDLNKTKAYMRTWENDNYASCAVQASRLFKKPNIIARITELMDERAKRMEINQDWVILNLKQVHDRAMQVEPVMSWDYEAKEMKPTGEYVFDSNGANKALELIGKHLNMFNKVDVSGKIDMANGLTPDQFNQLLQAAKGNAPSS